MSMYVGTNTGRKVELLDRGKHKVKIKHRSEHCDKSEEECKGCLRFKDAITMDVEIFDALYVECE